MREDGHIARRPPYGENPQVGERARQTYDRILQAAVRVFDRYGFQDARIDDVATSAHMARATVYQYFESKDEILQALSIQMGVELQGLVDQLEPVDGGPEGIETLKDWLAKLLTIAADYAPVVDAWFDPSANSNELTRMGRAFMRRFARRLGTKFGTKLGAAEREGYDLEIVAVMIFAVVDSIGGEVARKRLDVPEDQLFDELALMVHAALFTPPGA